MPYSSDLTDSEWKVLEPLLVEILPPKKQTLSLELDEARPHQWHLLSTEKWL
jgi:transposase